MRQKYQSKRWYSEEQRQRQQALAQQAQLQPTSADVSRRTSVATLQNIGNDLFGAFQQESTFAPVDNTFQRAAAQVSAPVRTVAGNANPFSVQPTFQSAV